MALSDLQTTIISYIQNALLENYPELSTTAGFPLADLFINPEVSLLQPLINMVNRTDLTQDLTNAALMTEDELDAIGVNNYGIPRIAGGTASGTVYVEMSPSFVGSLPIIIGPIVAATTSSLQFSSSSNTIVLINTTDIVNVDGTVLPEIAANYFNSSTNMYEFPIYVVAETAGSAYNVGTGVAGINTLVTNYPQLSGVFNTVSFNNGTNDETNIAYAARIQASFAAKNMGTAPGYSSYITTNFGSEGATDVYVAGYTNPLMIRDTIIVKSNGVWTVQHIGGKTDLYVRGTNYSNHTQLLYINSNTIRLEQPNLIASNAIIVQNVSNPSNNDIQVSVNFNNSNPLAPWCEATVIAGPSHILPSTGDELLFTYISYITGISGDSLLYNQTLYYNSSQARLNFQPFGVVSDIFNNTQLEDLGDPSTFYSISRRYPIIERGNCPTQTGLTSSQVLLDPTQRIAIDNYYLNDTIYILTGTGAGQSNIITAYNGLTTVPVSGAALGVASLVNPWSIQPSSSSTYIIRNCTNYSEMSYNDTQDITFNTNSVMTLTTATTLYAAITSTTAPSITVSSDVFPVVPFYINIDSEILNVTSKTGTIYTVSRGQLGTTAATHLVSAAVTQVTTAFNTGDQIALSYTYDELIVDIQDDLDIQENRIITTDALVREAAPLYIYVGLSIHCIPGTSVGTNELTLLTTIVQNALSSTAFSSTLSASELIGLIVNNSTVAYFVSYISQPIIFFASTTALSTSSPYFPSATNIPTIAGTAYYQSSISLVGPQYPVLGSLGAISI